MISKKEKYEKISQEIRENYLRIGESSKKSANGDERIIRNYITG